MPPGSRVTGQPWSPTASVTAEASHASVFDVLQEAIAEEQILML